jgi:hypothetical protein
MSDIALYFPYANFPSDAWIKAAALHWKQVGRIRPDDRTFAVHDSDTVKQLADELDFIVDLRPYSDGTYPTGSTRKLRGVERQPRARSPHGDTRSEVESLFYKFLRSHKDDLMPVYSFDALGIDRNSYEACITELLDPRLHAIYQSKLSYRLAHDLAREGLLNQGEYTYVMHRRLADVYLAILADVVARQNQITPVTDKALLSAVTSGWTVEAMAKILLDDESTEGNVDYGQAFAVLAMQTIVPKDLAEIPVKRIIEARRRLLPRLTAYRAFLDSLTPDFVEISLLPDPEVRAAKLRNHVESRIEAPIREMERQLGRLGLQPVRAVLSLQALAPPAVLGALADGIHLSPDVTASGVVAGCIVGAVSNALDNRRKILAGHPTGYLLNLREELGPSDTVANIRSAFRRVGNPAIPSTIRRTST